MNDVDRRTKRSHARTCQSAVNRKEHEGFAAGEDSVGSSIIWRYGRNRIAQNPSNASQEN